MAVKECEKCGNWIKTGGPSRGLTKCPVCGGELKRLACNFCQTHRHVKLRAVGAVKIACCPPCHLEQTADQ